MVCAPALFLIGIGVHARFLQGYFDFLAADPRSEQLILAYVPYMQDSIQFASPSNRPELDEARRAANRWIAGADSGDLKPLTSIAYEDTSSDGPKSEIFEVRRRIATRLIRGIADSAKNGNLHQAVSDGVVVLKLASVMKYSDFVSLFNCATEQRRVLSLLEPYAGQLTGEDRRALAAAVPALYRPPGTIDKMVRRSSQLFLSWRERRGDEPLSIEDTHLMSEMPGLAEDGSLIAARQVHERILASKDDHIPAYCSSLRLGMGAQEHLEREALSVAKLINKSAPR